MTGLLSYPFSRAHRVDFSGGARQVAYKQDVTTRAFDYYSGQQVSEDRENVATADSLNLGEASAALVFDTSISGVASPIRGSRYRLEVAQTSGTISYTGLTANARTYRMPFRPVTFAFRGLFFGRYGSGAEDYRLPTLYLGYPGLVRGYDSYSFESSECGLAPDGSARSSITCSAAAWRLSTPRCGCPALGPVRRQQLLRTAAGRDGVIRRQRRGLGPVQQPAVRSRVEQGSGVELRRGDRANLFGFAVAELDYVRPVDRPDRGWLWQFNLMPGF